MRNPNLLKQIAISSIVAFGIPLLLFPIVTSGFHPDAGKSGVFIVLIAIVGVPLLIGRSALKNFRLVIGFNLVITVSIVILSVAEAYRPNVLMQTGSILLALSWFVFVIINIISIFRFESFIPLGISLLCIILAFYSNRAGHHLRLHVFQKRLPQYREAVSVIENLIADEPVTLYGEKVPEKFRHLSYLISAERTKSDVLVVAFLWGGGFPAKHTNFVFVSDGGVPKRGSGFEHGWSHTSRINENWFKAGN